MSYKHLAIATLDFLPPPLKLKTVSATEFVHELRRIGAH